MMRQAAIRSMMRADHDWPSPDAKEANAATQAKTDELAVLTKSSPDSIAAPLIMVPSGFTLPAAHTLRSTAPIAGTCSHRRALLIVTLILIVWPLAQLTKIYDETRLYSGEQVDTAQGPDFRLPPRVWTWPAAYPRDVEGASKALGELREFVQDGLVKQQTEFERLRETIHGWKAPKPNSCTASKSNVHSIETRPSAGGASAGNSEMDPCGCASGHGRSTVAPFACLVRVGLCVGDQFRLVSQLNAD